MKVLIFTLFGAAALFAADEQQLALTIKAQTDFDRVQLAATPPLRDTAACIQTQAALVPVALPEDLPLVHFRKGYCTLAGATLTHEKKDFLSAAAEFDKTIEVWPARIAAMMRKKQQVEDVSSAVRVLAQVARLTVGTDQASLDQAAKELANAREVRFCPPSVMSSVLCGALLDIGRQWEGWMALRSGDFTSAQRDFSPTTAPGWSAWAAGKYAFRDRNYREAAAQYRRAVADWQSRGRQESAPLLERIGPPADLAAAYTELGGAQLLSGDRTGAIATLNQAVKAAPLDARAFFLRARARDLEGQSDAAIADYSVASRTAFANTQDQSSGEGHLYRGILLYRRRSFEQAEDEFSSALNFEITADLRSDAVAWRRMSAVAEGSCGPGRKYLEEALPSASPYFPSDEARALLGACDSTARAAAKH
jgi:tetratricopeptide (TPR) repeat protein